MKAGFGRFLAICEGGGESQFCFEHRSGQHEGGLFMYRICKTMVVSGAIFFGLMIWVGAGMAEDFPKTKSRPVERPWSFYLGVGTKTRDHTAEDFKAGMIEGGYVDGSSNAIPGWYAGTYQASPTGHSESPVVHGALGYDAGEHLSFRLFYNKGDFVVASGTDVIPELDQRNSISASGSLTSVGLLVNYRLTPALRLGAGPSFHRFSVDYIHRQVVDEDFASTVTYSETQGHNQLGLRL